MKGKMRERNLGRKLYIESAYHSKEVWSTYYWQTVMIRKCLEKSGEGEIKILEVGKGAGITAALLENIGYQVTTWDINKELKPTHVKDISALNEEDFAQKYDMVLCADVLEHIPLTQFDGCVKNLSRLSGRYILIMLPNNDIIHRISLGKDSMRKDFFYKRGNKKLYEGHCWELNYNEKTNLSKIIPVLEKYMKIIKRGIVADNPYEYYFVCRVRE